MATLQSIDFHNEKMAQERERVMLRIANGLKSDSSAVIANRMAHPSFRGLPDNSTGSRNMPFFATKDESHISLEDKILARGGADRTPPRHQQLTEPPALMGRVRRTGPPSRPPPGGSPGHRRTMPPSFGALPPVPTLQLPQHLFQQAPLPLQTHVAATNQLDANPNVIAPPFIPPNNQGSGLTGGVLKNYKYARKILNRRKEDIENQLLNEEGLPRQPPMLTVLTELDSRKMELANVLDFIGQSVAAGDYGVVSSMEARNLFRLIISLAPAFTEDELADVVRILENIIDNLEEGVRDTTQGERDVDDIHSSRRKARLINAGGSVMSRLLAFLREISRIVNSPVMDKVKLSTVLAQELGASVGLRETMSGIKKTVEDIEIAKVEEERMPASLIVSPEGSVAEEIEEQQEQRQMERAAPLEQHINNYMIRRQAVLDEAMAAYRSNNVGRLQQMLRENAPRLRADKYYRANASRTVLLNAIKNAL